MSPRRRHPTSPPANPLDDENLLAEFLLRLPPRPSSLPRAGAVCKSWRRVVTDPHFLRRFRARHGTPPLLGFFDPCGKFYPTLKSPDRVPSERLSGDWDMAACRDGLILCRRGRGGSELQVLDLMTGDRSDLLTIEANLPETLKVDLAIDSTSTGVDGLRFHLFALSTDHDHKKLSASVYSSDSGAWTHSDETLIYGCTLCFIRSLGTLIGDAFYWLYADAEILRYDLGTQALAAFGVPGNEEGDNEYYCRYMFMTKDGLLCVVMLHEYKHIIQFWVLDTAAITSVAEWVLRKIVTLDTPLPAPEPPELQLFWSTLRIVWFEEEDNVIFLFTETGIVAFNLESMEFMKLSEEIHYNEIHPYLSFMTAGRDINLFCWWSDVQYPVS